MGRKKTRRFSGKKFLRTVILASLIIILASKIHANALKEKNKAVVSSTEDVVVIDSDKLHENQGTYSQSKYLNELINEITQYISTLDGEYSVYFYNIVTKEEFGINEDTCMIAASTTKIPINFFYYTQVASGREDPNMKLQYTKQDYDSGCGSIQYSAFGTRYTLRQLSKLSLQVSDNVATNMLCNHLGRQNIEDFMNKTLEYQVDFKNNKFTAKEMGTFMLKSYEFSLANKEGEEFMEYLKTTVFNDRLTLYLPKDIAIAHKIGNYEQYVHDVGLIFTSRPYVLAIMTKEAPNANEGIAHVSKLIYDYESTL